MNSKYDMIKFSDRFERIISAILLGFAIVIIVFQVAQLIWTTIEVFAKRFREAGLEYAPQYGRNVAVLFFNILLMMEIMQTIKVFADTHIIKVRVILIVCLIAVSRKILASGEEVIDPMTEFSIAGLVLALAISYYLVSKNIKELVEEEQKNAERKI